MKYKYTRDNLEPIVKKCFSWAEVLRCFNLKQNGGTQNFLKKSALRLEIPFNHFKGQAWLKGRTYERVDIQDYLNNIRQINSHTLKNKLFKKEIKKRCCENCKLDSWLDNPIPLELHHVDGNNENNNLNNLQILCPNCHSLTPNFTGKKLKKIRVNEVKVDKRSLRKIRPELWKVKIRPLKDDLLEEVEELGFCATGRKYGVSDNCIRKWLNADVR